MNNFILVESNIKIKLINMSSIQQYYELTGIVTDIIEHYNKFKPNKPIVFTLKTANNVSYKVECGFYYPVFKNDACQLTVSILDKEKKIVKVVKQPFVTIPIDKDNVINFFMDILKDKVLDLLLLQNYMMIYLNMLNKDIMVKLL